MTPLPYTITENLGNRHVAAIFFNGDGSPVESEHKVGRLLLYFGCFKHCAVPVVSSTMIRSRRNPPWLWMDRQLVAKMLSDRSRSAWNMVDRYALSLVCRTILAAMSIH